MPKRLNLVVHPPPRPPGRDRQLQPGIETLRLTGNIGLALDVRKDIFPETSPVGRQQLDHNQQRGIHGSVPHNQFAQNDDIASMNQRYNVPPIRRKQERPTGSKIAKNTCKQQHD